MRCSLGRERLATRGVPKFFRSFGASCSPLLSWRLCGLTLYRRFGQAGERRFLLFSGTLRGADCRGCRLEHRSLLWRRRVEGMKQAPFGRATSYLSIDSSRSSDSREACEVQDAVWGARSGASRNLRRDVRASDEVFSPHLQAARGHRFQMGALSVALRGASARRRVFYIAPALDVLARDTRLGVRSRR